MEEKIAMFVQLAHEILGYDDADTSIIALVVHNGSASGNVGGHHEYMYKSLCHAADRSLQFKELLLDVAYELREDTDE